MPYDGTDEIYRKNRCAYTWRCEETDRNNLKLYAVLEKTTMNELLSKAWKQYMKKLEKKHEGKAVNL